MDNPHLRILNNFIALIGCLLLFTACGKKDEPAQSSLSGGEVVSFLLAGGGAGLDLTLESCAFYDAAPELKGEYSEGKFLGMQFYQGEPVQLWASARRPDGNVSVYMYRQDGTRETCIESIGRLDGYLVAFRDSQGYCYKVTPGENFSISKLDSGGNALYTVRVEGDRGRIKSICERADGRLAMLVGADSGPVDYDIALLDTKGKLTVIAMPERSPGLECYIGTSGENLLLIRDEKIYRVGLSEEKLELLFSFALTPYTVIEFLKQITFCLREDGRLEVLRSDLLGSAACELLSLRERAADKQEIVLRGLYVKNKDWLKESVLRFNSSNEKYMVVIEGPEEWDDWNDYFTRTGVELAAGKGPDILVGELAKSPGSLIEKGMLVDLAPLMAKSGIKEEDYFPIVFDTWRAGEKIYSINYSGGIKEPMISSAVLGDAEYPGIEAVADALLAYSGNAVYRNRFSASDILRELLEGSETLWGMVDWEKGICNFGGELFRKLLEAARRYRYDERNNYPAICANRGIWSFYALYNFPTLEETRAEGNVPVGQLFDDGSHPVAIFTRLNDVLAINANSACREGAWEFLQFLLSDETQEHMLERFEEIPVKRSVFWSAVEEECLNGPTPKNMNSREGGIIKAPLPRKRAEAYEALLNEARALPYKTEAILEIILEEAQEYFDGVKEIPQVVDAIENRVGLYLEERK